MGQLTYSLPIINSSAATEDPKVRTALDDIKTIINGALAVDNLSAALRELLVPSGAILEFGGTTTPAGFLACDGTEVPASATGLISALAGNPYGVGGNGRPKTPDMRGRVPVAAGSGSGLTPRSLAATGGTETHTLTTAQMPQHDHSVSNHNHSNIAQPLVVGGQGTGFASGQAGGNFNIDFRNDANINAASFSTNNNGSGQAHNIMQPFIVINFIIKT